MQRTRPVLRDSSRKETAEWTYQLSQAHASLMEGLVTQVAQLAAALYAGSEVGTETAVDGNSEYCEINTHARLTGLIVYSTSWHRTP